MGSDELKKKVLQRIIDKADMAMASPFAPKRMLPEEESDSEMLAVKPEMTSMEMKVESTDPELEEAIEAYKAMFDNDEDEESIAKPSVITGGY